MFRIYWPINLDGQTSNGPNRPQSNPSDEWLIGYVDTHQSQTKTTTLPANPTHNQLQSNELFTFVVIGRLSKEIYPLTKLRSVIDSLSAQSSFQSTENSSTTQSKLMILGESAYQSNNQSTNQTSSRTFIGVSLENDVPRLVDCSMDLIGNQVNNLSLSQAIDQPINCSFVLYAPPTRGSTLTSVGLPTCEPNSQTVSQFERSLQQINQRLPILDVIDQLSRLDNQPASPSINRPDSATKRTIFQSIIILVRLLDSLIALPVFFLTSRVPTSFNRLFNEQLNQSDPSQSSQGLRLCDMSMFASTLLFRVESVRSIIRYFERIVDHSASDQSLNSAIRQSKNAPDNTPTTRWYMTQILDSTKMNQIVTRPINQLIIDVLLGIIVYNILTIELSNGQSVYQSINLSVNHFFDSAHVHRLVDWLVDQPNGLKLNQSINEKVDWLIGCLFYAREWIFAQPIYHVCIALVNRSLNLSWYFGLSLSLSIIADVHSINQSIFSLLFRLFRSINRAISQSVVILARLFQGKKYNVLKQRVDSILINQSANQSINQSVLHVLMFIFLIFIWPNFISFLLLFLYFYFFCFLLYFLCYSLVTVLTRFPIDCLIVRLIDRSLFIGSCELVVLNLSDDKLVRRSIDQTNADPIIEAQMQSLKQDMSDQISHNQSINQTLDESNNHQTRRYHHHLQLVDESIRQSNDSSINQSISSSTSYLYLNPRPVSVGSLFGQLYKQSISQSVSLKTFYSSLVTGKRLLFPHQSGQSD